MKKSRSIISVILFSLVLIVFLGIVICILNKDKIEGSFFRKMYGSIGVVDNNEYIMNMELFCFDNEIDFLKDPEKLSFDNNNVIINSVTYEEQSREKDLITYLVCFNVSFANPGRQDVSSLIYSGEENSSTTYTIGKLSFIYNDKDGIYLKHGCDTTITDNKAVFSFSEGNADSFVINDLILADDDRAKFVYDKNISYMPGTELTYVLHAEFSGNDRDLFIVQPIFEIELGGTKKLHYFVPNISAQSGKNLTYSEIREYIK